MRSSVTAALAGLVLAGAAAHAQPQPAGVEACTACHGPGGNSPTATVPSIAGQPRVFIENQLVLIREGLRDVPAMKAVMGGLNDAEIVALAQHFAAQPALPPPGQPQPDRFSAGAAVSKRALCGTCHLPDYSGQNQVPRLARQHEAYLAVTLKMYRDNPAPGRDTAMSAVLYGLKDAELEHLAHYFAHHGK
jgi:cytochrome c553